MLLDVPQHCLLRFQTHRSKFAGVVCRVYLYLYGSFHPTQNTIFTLRVSWHTVSAVSAFCSKMSKHIERTTSAHEGNWAYFLEEDERHGVPDPPFAEPDGRTERLWAERRRNGGFKQNECTCDTFRRHFRSMLTRTSPANQHRTLRWTLLGSTSRSTACCAPTLFRRRARQVARFGEQKRRWMGF